MLRSPSPSIELSAAAMPPLQELHAMAGVHQLPVQDIEDQSLIYPRWRSTKNEAKPLVIDGLIFKSRFKLLGDCCHSRLRIWLGKGEGPGRVVQQRDLEPLIGTPLK